MRFSRAHHSAVELETAGSTVGRYLLLFSLINLAYGIATGTVAWLVGLPSAPLWGLVAFLLRFIPYVGAISSAILPALVAFALFPGWSRALEILGAFVIIDQVAAQFAEPLIIGHGIDVSPVVLLISAMYWSWLWGIPGLAAFDAYHRVPQGCRRLRSSAGISRDIARRGPRA